MLNKYKSIIVSVILVLGLTLGSICIASAQNTVLWECNFNDATAAQTAGLSVGGLFSVENGHYKITANADNKRVQSNDIGQSDWDNYEVDFKIKGPLGDPQGATYNEYGILVRKTDESNYYAFHVRKFGRTGNFRVGLRNYTSDGNELLLQYADAGDFLGRHTDGTKYNPSTGVTLKARVDGDKLQLFLILDNEEILLIDHTDNTHTSGKVALYANTQEDGTVVEFDYVKITSLNTPASNPPVPVQAPVDDIKVTINGELQTYDQPPLLVNSRTLVPLRGIFEALGATVSWEGTTSTVTAVRGDITVVLRIGDVNAFVNGKEVILDQPAELINSRTMVPVRFISESMGAKVDWEAATQTVVITTDK